MTPSSVRIAAISAFLAMTLMGITCGAAFAGTRVRHHLAIPPARIRMLPTNANGAAVAGPGYFRLRARPGQVEHAYISIANEGGVAGTVEIVPVDATSGVYGGVSYDLPGRPRTAVGSWIRPKVSSVRLTPMQSVVVPVRISASPRLKPGVHVGGLTAFVPTTTSTGSSFGSLQVQVRVVLAVVVTVPGPAVSDVRVDGVSTKYEPTGLYVVTHIRNSGNRFARTDVHLTVRAPGARKLTLNRYLHVDTTVPGTSVFYPVAWPGNVKYGRYIAIARTTNGRPSSQSRAQILFGRHETGAGSQAAGDFGLESGFRKLIRLIRRSRRPNSGAGRSHWRGGDGCDDHHRPAPTAANLGCQTRLVMRVECAHEVYSACEPSSEPSSFKTTSAMGAGTASSHVRSASSASALMPSRKSDAAHGRGTMGKCTLCYDRLKAGDEPACAKACPTASIQYGTVDELRERAQTRLAEVRDTTTARVSTSRTKMTASAAADRFSSFSIDPKCMAFRPIRLFQRNGCRRCGVPQR